MKQKHAITFFSVNLIHFEYDIHIASFCRRKMFKIETNIDTHLHCLRFRCKLVRTLFSSAWAAVLRVRANSIQNASARTRTCACHLVFNDIHFGWLVGWFATIWSCAEYTKSKCEPCVSYTISTNLWTQEQIGHACMIYC